MSEQTGYSIRYREDGTVAATVSSLETGRWRIENLEKNKATDPADKREPMTMVVPGDQVRSAMISLPHLKKKELGLAAAGWVAREESTPPNHWRVSWREHGDHGGNHDQKNVFLLYATTEDVDGWLAAARTSFGAPTHLLPDYMVLEQMFRQCHPDSRNLDAWNLVFVGRQEHFLCVSTRSGLLLTRPLPADLSAGSDPAEYLGRLATEVDRSVFFARQTEHNPDLQRIIVCGDRDLATGLVERLGQETNIPTEYWNVADHFEWEDRVLDSHLMLPVMAAALSVTDLAFNLLPGKQRALLTPAVLRHLTLAGATAAVVTIPLLVAGGLLTANIQDRYLDRAQGRLEQATRRANEATEIYRAERVLQAREDHIASVDRHDQDYAEVLLHLADLTPEAVVYKDLRLEENRDGHLVLYLTGESTADTATDAQQSFLDFQRALDGSRILATTGEPRKLIITVSDDEALDVKKVEFSLEYRVQPTQPIQDAVATVAVRGGV